jgi:hypothetical protein
MHPRAAGIPKAQPRDKILVDEAPVASDLGAGHDPPPDMGSQRVRMDAQPGGGLFQRQQPGVRHRA